MEDGHRTGRTCRSTEGQLNQGIDRPVGGVSVEYDERQKPMDDRHCQGVCRNPTNDARASWAMAIISISLCCGFVTENDLMPPDFGYCVVMLLTKQIKHTWSLKTSTSCG